MVLREDYEAAHGIGHNSGATFDEQLADDMAEFYDDPLGHVMYSYAWDTDPALQVVDWEATDIFVDPHTGQIYNERPLDKHVVTYKFWMTKYRKRYNSRYGPDKWACEFLDQIGEEVRKRGFDGRKAVKAIQCATASGHGIGKSTLVAWIIKWILDTRPYSRGTVTANTADQLRTKTWAELGKWHRRSITSHWYTFSHSRGNMAIRHVRHPGEWYCTAQTCREENSEAFAGQHAANASSFYVFDEASNVPDKIFEVREGGTTDGEPMVFDFGNPTRNSGQFYEECEGRFKKRFIVRKIDSRTVLITNKERIREWIEDYGIDSDFVKVRVLGEFPSAGSLQFIPTEWVRRAMMRPDIVDRNAAVTIGVDVGRHGPDNSVIYPVLGSDARTFAPKLGDGVYNGLDGVEVAQKVIEKIHFFEDLNVEVVGLFVDVGGPGSSVVDTLNHSGYPCTPVNFGNSAVFEPERYRYRSDEMWGRTKEEIKTRLVLPNFMELVEEDYDPSETSMRDTGLMLFRDLTQREFGYTLADKIHLETKADMKARGLNSPDIGDALCLNFCQEVQRVKDQPQGRQGVEEAREEHYDPLENVSAG